MAVDDDVAAAVGATKEGVVGGLHAGTSDHVAGRVEGVAVIVGEHLLGDLADITDEVGREAVTGVKTSLLIEGFEFGEFVAVGGDECLLVGSDVLFERDRLVAGGDLVVAEDGVNLVDGEVKTLRDERQVGIEVLDLFAEKVAGNGGIVVDEEASLAVEELAARSEDGHLSDAVGLGERPEVVGVDYLKAPEPDQKNGKDQRDQVLGGVKLAGRQLFCFAPGAAVPGFRMVDWFHV
jgi:hypothetical protein